MNAKNYFINVFWFCSIAFIRQGISKEEEKENVEKCFNSVYIHHGGWHYPNEKELEIYVKPFLEWYFFQRPEDQGYEFYFAIENKAFIKDIGENAIVIDGSCKGMKGKIIEYNSEKCEYSIQIDRKTIISTLSTNVDFC